MRTHLLRGYIFFSLFPHPRMLYSPFPSRGTIYPPAISANRRVSALRVKLTILQPEISLLGEVPKGQPFSSAHPGIISYAPIPEDGPLILSCKMSCRWVLWRLSVLCHRLYVIWQRDVPICTLPTAFFSVGPCVFRKPATMTGSSFHRPEDISGMNYRIPLTGCVV
jgi:hypothetical protein